MTVRSDPLRLLLVGDASRLEAAARAALPDAQLACAETAHEAVAALTDEPPIALLLDEELRDVDRGRLLALLRHVDADLPVVLVARSLTADRRVALVAELDLHGVWDETEAPARLEELVVAARGWRRRERASQLGQELRELVVAKLCHDMRNHLHVIQGYADLLRGGVDEASRDDVHARLEGASGAALTLVIEYLELARLWWNDADPREDEVDLDALLEELRALAEQQVGSRPVEVGVLSSVAGARLRTDEHKLRAILVQLLAHAVKFTPAGRVWLSVTVDEDGTDFLVVDDGPPIAVEALAEGFDPFRALRDHPGGAAPGQGIGLALAQRLTTLLGGTLDALPGEPRGTVLRLSLPVRASLPPPGAPLRYH